MLRRSNTLTSIYRAVLPTKKLNSCTSIRLVSTKRAMMYHSKWEYNNTAALKRQQFNTVQHRFNSINTSTTGNIIPEDVTELKNEEYHNLSTETFEQILDELDAFFEESKIMEAEIDEEAGVMSINCSEGTYVINKQPPTKQIWLSSPISGPKRFDYYDNCWVCLRDGEKLSSLLEKEMNQMYGNFKWSKPF